MNDFKSESDDRRTLLEEAAAIDALTGGGAHSFEESLLLDPVYLKARREFESVVTGLALSSPPATPPARLKGRLLARIAAERPEVSAHSEAIDNSNGAFEVVPGVTAVRTGNAKWKDAPLPGVSYKVFSRDEERGYTTRLVRFAPGTSYPKHRHGGVEEIFLLEGTIQVNGITLGAGDYCRSEEGTEEFGTFSPNGALAIIVSSDLDEITAS